jgi:hypothetical protein
MSDDDFERLKREIIFDRVAGTIKEDPENWADRLEELGFQWFDDEDDQEENEEAAATPANQNEQLIVDYLEGTKEPSEKVLAAFIEETESENPNCPLFRRYFKKGNPNLKKLLMYGLGKNPNDMGLLGDLGYFHENRNILGNLIRSYVKACEIEQNMANFEKLVLSFCYDTHPDGFDAIAELDQHYPPESTKGKILKKIRQEQEMEPEVIKF